MAAEAISPLDQEAWLKLAGDWLRLADSTPFGLQVNSHE